MRASLIVIILALAMVGATGSAHAAAPFELIDRGDQVEVIAHGWTVVDPSAVVVNRERIELVVAGGLTEARRSYEDPTIRRVEIRGREPRVLSIKFRGEHDRVVKLAALATVTQVGDDIHVVIPRAASRPQPAAATTASTAAAATNAANPPSVEPAPAPVLAAPAPAPVETVEPTTVAATSARPRPTASATGSRWWLMLTGLVLLGGGGALFARKRRRAPVATERIEVIDSRPLGGKARVVWLGAGDRELVVAVSAKQVRLLGQWRRNRDGAADPIDFDAPPRTAMGSGNVPRLKPVPVSPSVSGILRLRDRPSPLADELVSGDVADDEEWARDILAATGGRK